MPRPRRGKGVEIEEVVDGEEGCEDMGGGGQRVEKIEATRSRRGAMYFHGREEGQRATPISTVVTIVGVSDDYR